MTAFWRFRDFVFLNRSTVDWLSAHRDSNEDFFSTIQKLRDEIESAQKRQSSSVIPDKAAKKKKKISGE